MTRTVEQARRWPMPNDVWRIEHWSGEWKVGHVVGSPIKVTLISRSLDQDRETITLDQFRALMDLATPVRVFEGEA